MLTAIFDFKMCELNKHLIELYNYYNRYQADLCIIIYLTF